MALAEAILLWLHIVSAVGWLGSLMVFGTLIAPTLPSLAPANRAELVVKLFPKFARYAMVFTVITPIFGVATMLDISNGNFAIFNPSTSSFSMYITAGALLTLVTWVVGFGLVLPTVFKIVRLTEAMSGGGPPSPDLARATTRLRVGSGIVVVLLLIVLYLMVAAVTA